MSETIERSSLDLRYEGHRLRNDAAEARLLASIAERGIEEPLGGVDTPQGPLLLDGFRRNRCAAKLGIECVPYVSWGEGEAQGIVSLLSARRQRTLSILEQARFVDELLSTHSMAMAEVAELLSRSKAWVSTRHNLLAQMSPAIQAILFRGAFPVYSYMVTLRPFMRMNGIGQTEIERFVQAVAGSKLSVREIELLAHGYFRGTPSLRQAIDEGNWKWTLQRANIPEMLEIETFPFDKQPKLDRQRIMSLYDNFDYMTKQRGVIWLGPTGCGKTGLATSFLLHAIDRGYRGYFVTFPELIQELFQSLADRSDRKVFRRYLSYDCLVIDEVGYVEVEPAQVGQFFTLMHKRHRRKTTIITSNLGFSEWGSFLKNPQLTAALSDRLTSNSHVINMRDCDSLRGGIDE